MLKKQKTLKNVNGKMPESDSTRTHTSRGLCRCQPAGGAVGFLIPRPLLDFAALAVMRPSERATDLCCSQTRLITFRQLH